MKAVGIFMAIAASFFFMACGNRSTADAKLEKHEGHDTGNIVQSATPITSTPFTLQDQGIHAIFQQYTQLTTALTNSNFADAKIAANAIEAGAKEVTGAGSVASTAAKITNAADIETQRNAYATLSNKIIELVKQSGLNNGELYVDYCPMALNDKGASWLSTQKEIKNPYFGEKMMTCGEIKETIR